MTMVTFTIQAIMKTYSIHQVICRKEIQKSFRWSFRVKILADVIIQVIIYSISA